MKAIAVFLLFIAAAFATVNWSSYTCAQLGALTPISSTSITCADWANFPQDEVTCLSITEACYVGQTCNSVLTVQEQQWFASYCAGHQSGLTGGSGSTTGAPQRP